MGLDGQTAFVTGGGSGIGAATARRLALDGARVVVADIDVDGADKVAAETGGEAVPLDVKDVASVRDAVAAGERAIGPIDILINNAGTDRFAFFVDTNEDTWDHVLGVNLRGTLACTHAVLPGMQERHTGVIVNVASEAGVVGTLAGATYAASKAGIIGFTKSIAREAARYGVRCNAVAPGPIDTPLLNGAVEASGARGDAFRQGMIDATAMARLGTPDEVAGAIAFLVSDDASFVTGHTLAVSGGLSMTS
ncbi:MAG: SDR family NAD(P)-dependent oxidoreductase [Actinomycetota bacterium]